MLELLQVMEAPGFQIATWPVHEPELRDGLVVHQMPYPEYDPVVDRFWELCYKSSCYIDPYAVLPEDPPGLEHEMDVVDVLRAPRDMEKATLNQIRRYFVLCTRGERFCDGYIQGQFEDGCLRAALLRLAALRAGMQ